MKRRELEIQRLKLLADKKTRRAAVPGALKQAEVTRASRRKGRVEVKKEEDVESLQTIIRHLEKSNKELVAENFELKRFQEQMKRDMQHLLSLRREDSLSDFFHQETEGDMSQSHGSASEQLTHSICEQWRSLKRHLQRLERRGEDRHDVIPTTDHEREISVLKREIAESRDLIVMQQQIMQEQLLAAQNGRLPSQVRGSYFLEEQLRLQEERGKLEQQKRTLQAERWNFTEAAIRLGYERKQLEEERALFLKHQFLNMVPSLDQRSTFPWPALGLEHGNLTEAAMWLGPSENPYLLPGNARASTPPAVSASKQRVETPSTAELYRVLKLTPENRTFSVGESFLCDCGQQSMPLCLDERENLSPLHSERSQIPASFNRRESACQTQTEDFLLLRSNLLSQFLDASF
ncbi:afadin- and alpha-actinin-binding protein-like [Rhinatrema bivittatum]|uniref:afadin- and alpha-actinin-binding protein-like n=1 Tax=Rhinatrema bivittatum TaxID=194408 RepID=UPI00112CF55A|nr:afadin- and alpha-actinin-binding protein-like [Rhinatrema bivittatum]